MTPVATTYDNIRLIRRKVGIAQQEVASIDPGSRRDQAVVRLVSLTQELVRAVQDFADLGYEEEVAKMLAQIPDTRQRALLRAN